ncbi:MAG TPA: methyltransferase domain-containing protein [Candidatus Acidoferrales bacterium]|nr:methyltransferase domain-containing protein [Candidatus Acidoferrales bacterium]
MHNPRTLGLARRLLPRFLLRRLDPFHSRIEEKLAEFAASLPPGERVLDAGAGECRFQAFFPTNHYVSVDNTAGDASWDYSRLSAIADLAALPFASGSFAAAISVVVLEHLADPEAALREMRRVLEAGGRCLVAVPQIWELHQEPHDFYRYTRYGLEHLLRSAGFRVVELEPTGGYFQLAGKLSIDLLQFFERGAGWILFVPLAPVFGFLVPLACYYLDKLDRKKAFAVGFVAVAEAAA